MKTLFQYIAYFFFRLLIFVFSLLPFKLLYLLSDLLCFVFKKLLKYRVKVIKRNLAYCFEAYSNSDQEAIFNQYYQQFIDIILESIKGLSIHPDKLIPRYKFLNPEVLNTHFKHGGHLILYSQHFNNWEWAPICLGLQMKHELVGIIKSLSNPHINKYMIGGRSGNNVSVVPTFNTHRYFKRLSQIQKPKGIVFIADQRPYGKNKALNLNFLGKATSFHLGAATYATATNYPVYTLDIKRIARGYYTAEAFKLTDSAKLHSPEELTELYAMHLEDLVKENPASWLWSHKRFKEIINYN